MSQYEFRSTFRRADLRDVCEESDEIVEEIYSVLEREYAFSCLTRDRLVWHLRAITEGSINVTTGLLTFQTYRTPSHVRLGLERYRGLRV